jgi:hypothetical protein
MVVGHTVREEGVSAVCGGAAWRIDVGLGRTEGAAGRVGASQVLELTANDSQSQPPPPPPGAVAVAVAVAVRVRVLGVHEERMGRWRPHPPSSGSS